MVIYIHGIGKHPPEEAWKREWDIALFGKPMGKATVPAYWSDILHGKPDAAPAGLRTQSTRARRTRSAGDDALDVDAILKAAQVPAAKRKQAGDRLERLAAAVASADFAGARSVSVRGIGKRILPLPGFMRRPIARLFLEQFLKDVAAYFYQPGKRGQIQDRLRAAIKDADESFVLVSHSLGTVIAFEVLADAKLTRTRPVCDLLVTMGSPLGIQEVQDVLLDFGNELIVPDKLRAWRNFADRLDPVALDATLANDFDSRSTDDGLVRPVDEKIVNERTTSLRELNPHSSIGYLSHPVVRKAVHHQIEFDTYGRFVVARDVAEEFVDPDRRIPVLIEALEPEYRAVDESDADRRKRERKQPAEERTLDGRIRRMKKNVEDYVVERLHGRNVPKAKRDDVRRIAGAVALRKYVSARLTPNEINSIVARHADFNVYAVWRNSNKRKVLERSHGPLKADAGRTSYGATGRGVTWAVLDTGVRWDHPHFIRPGAARGTVAEVWDCTQHTDEPVRLLPASGKRASNPARGDRDGHGTHVCGIIAGEHADGRRRIQGLAPQAELIVYKVLDDEGNGNDEWIIKAIDHIFRTNQSAASGLKVHGVNVSLGGPFDASVYGCGFAPICKELRDLWRQGVLVCVAAGNEGQIQVKTTAGDFDLNALASIGDPANLEDCIAVGSVNADKPNLYGVSWFSSRGPTADGRPKPDVVAPGERILSCSASIPAAGKSAGKAAGKGVAKPAAIEKLYRHESGTSMACPHVSGLLAAFLSVRREYLGRPDDVKRILLDNCNDLGRDRYHQGAGMPNLMKMLMNA